MARYVVVDPSGLQQGIGLLPHHLPDQLAQIGRETDVGKLFPAEVPADFPYFTLAALRALCQRGGPVQGLSPGEIPVRRVVFKGKLHRIALSPAVLRVKADGPLRLPHVRHRVLRRQRLPPANGHALHLHIADLAVLDGKRQIDPDGLPLPLRLRRYLNGAADSVGAAHALRLFHPRHSVFQQPEIILSAL